MDQLLAALRGMKPGDFEHSEDYIAWLEVQLELQARKGEDDD